MLPDVHILRAVFGLDFLIGTLLQIHVNYFILFCLSQIHIIWNLLEVPCLSNVYIVSNLCYKVSNCLYILILEALFFENIFSAMENMLLLF